MQQACQTAGPRAPRIHRIRLWVPFFMMAGISILSGSAGVELGGWSFAGIDKLGHLVVFGLLGIAWVRSFRPAAWNSRRRFLYALLLAAGFGLLDELHQYRNPLRSFEWADLLADILGAGGGCLAYLGLPRLRRLLEVNLREVWCLLSAGKGPQSAHNGREF